MPYDRFGRFYEPTPPPDDTERMLTNLPNAPGRFRSYSGSRYEDEFTRDEIARMEAAGLIVGAPAPIGPEPRPYRRPNPWSLEQPQWYELTPQGDTTRSKWLSPEQRKIEELERQGIRPFKTERFPLRLPTRGRGMEDYGVYPEIPEGYGREIQPGGPPYVDREPPSVWGPGPGYNAPMYPEDLKEQAIPIPRGPMRGDDYNPWRQNYPIEGTLRQVSNPAPERRGPGLASRVQPGITITIGGTEQGSDLENPANPLSQFMNFWYPPQYQARRQEPPPMQSQRSYLPMMRQGTNERITWPQGQPVRMNEPLPWSRIDNPWRVVEQIERQRGR